MKTSKFLIIFLLYIPFLCRAQVSEIQWLNNYGGTDGDYFTKIIFTSDSNYLAVGYTASDDNDIEFNNGSFDYFVAKIDTNGNVLWINSYGGSGSDKCYGVAEADGGSFMLAGESYSSDGDVSATHDLKNIWVVLIDSVGEIIWEKTFGGSINETAQSIIENSKGNFVICGETNSNDGDVSGNHLFGTYDYWVFEITLDGTLIRQKCFGGTDDDKGLSIISGYNNDYLVTGYSESEDGDVTTYDASTHLWAVCFDSVFTINWVYGFGGSGDDRGHSAVLTSDTNFILVGKTFSEEIPGFIGGVIDGVIIKLDQTGELIWYKMFGGLHSESINNIYTGGDNNYLITGNSISSTGDIPENNGFNDGFISEITGDGDVLGTVVIGGSQEDIGHSVIGSSLLNFVAAGDFYSDDFDFPINYGYKDAFILKYHECTQTFYKDIDGDGFGDVLTDSVACNIPIGYVSDSTDCNDTNPDIHPLLLDVCNSIDDNCNGATDEDAIFNTYYLDNDGDLFGDILFDTTSCNIVIGYVDNNEDCNDINSEINPLMSETCNGIDDNCNIEIDEGLTIYTFYIDVDGDTYGNPDASIDTCIETIIGYVNNSLDCNDTIAGIYPGAIELCNYLDDDCDGLNDDNLTYILSYQDNDGDDFGNPLIDSLSCELPIGYVVNNTDCDDTNAAIYPGAEEVLNGIDDDCDQVADEGLSINDPATNTFSLHPNPTFSTIQIKAKFNEKGTYNIYSSTGQLIISGVWNSGEQIISVISLATGVYSIQLEASDTIASGFFVKL